LKIYQGEKREGISWGYAQESEYSDGPECWARKREGWEAVRRKQNFFMFVTFITTWKFYHLFSPQKCSSETAAFLYLIHDCILSTKSQV
jgi:hypothetical protein